MKLEQSLLPTSISMASQTGSSAILVSPMPYTSAMARGGVLESAEFGQLNGRTYSIAIGDMNNDRLPDIVVGNAGQPNAVYFNAGDGLSFREQSFGSASGITYNLAVGDLDEDGFLDIAVANSDGQNPIFLNRPAK